MFIEKHQIAAASKIAVISTATPIFDLINTSIVGGGGTAVTNAGFSSQVNGLDIVIEDGSIRVLFEDNTPTSANGLLLSPGIYFLRNVPVNKMRLIRAGSANVACSVQIGRCLPGESSMVASTGTATGTSADQVQGNSASGATDAGNPVKIGGVYNSTPPTFVNGQRGDIQLDINGNLLASLGTKLAGEDQSVDVLKVEHQFTSAFITTATTTTSKSGAGRLHSINIMKTLTGAVDVYDNTAGSGTKLASFAATTTPGTYILDATFNTGLTTVTGAADTIQLNYR